MVTRGAINRTRTHPNLEIALMFFPELRAAITDIAAFMDDDEGPDFNAAQQRAIDAYGSELLPRCSGASGRAASPVHPGPIDTLWSCSTTQSGFAGAGLTGRAAGAIVWCSEILIGRRSSTRPGNFILTSSPQLNDCGSGGSGSG
jgi:hypothetical protein